MAVPIGLDPKRTAVHFKTESTGGSYEAPSVGTDLALSCNEISWELTGEPEGDRSDEHSAVPAYGVDLINGFGIKINFSAKLPSWADTSVSSLANHPLQPFFAACLTTITPGSTDGDDLAIRIAGPVSSVSPCSILISEYGGNDIKLQGGIGNIEKIGPETAGGPIIITGSVTGIWVANPAATAITHSSVVYSTQPILKNALATFTDGGISGTPAGLGSWEFTPGTTVEETEDASFTYGRGIPVPKHSGRPTLKLNMNAQNETDYAVWTKWSGQATAAAGVSVGSPGSVFQCNLPAAFVAKPEQAEGNGVRKWDVTLKGSWSSTYAAEIVFS